MKKKNLSAMQETWVPSLGQKDPLGKGTATHSSILALRISGTEEPAAAAKSLQSCPTLCDPIDCSQPGSSVRGILQARILEWVAVPFSRGSSPPRDQTQVSPIAGRFLTI